MGNLKAGIGTSQAARRLVRLVALTLVFLSLPCLAVSPSAADMLEELEEFNNKCKSRPTQFIVKYYSKGVTIESRSYEKPNATLRYYGPKLEEMVAHQALMQALRSVASCKLSEEQFTFNVAIGIKSYPSYQEHHVYFDDSGKVYLDGKLCEVKSPFPREILQTVESVYGSPVLALGPKAGAVVTRSSEGQASDEDRFLQISLLKHPSAGASTMRSEELSNKSLSRLLLDRSAESAKILLRSLASSSSCRKDVPEGMALLVVDGGSASPRVGYDGDKNGFIGQRWCEFSDEMRALLNGAYLKPLKRWQYVRKQSDKFEDPFHDFISDFRRRAAGGGGEVLVYAVPTDANYSTPFTFEELVSQGDRIFEFEEESLSSIPLYNRLIEALLSPGACDVLIFGYTDLRLAIRIVSKTEGGPPIDVGFGTFDSGVVNGLPCYLGPKLQAIKQELWGKIRALPGSRPRIVRP